jgi:hypothetical protein
VSVCVCVRTDKHLCRCFGAPARRVFPDHLITDHLILSSSSDHLPHRLPTPTEEADGNGYGVITGRGGPSRPPPRVSVNLVPLLLTGVRLHPPAPKGGPTSTSADASVPRLAGFSLITYLLTTTDHLIRKKKKNSRQTLSHI